MLLCVVCTAAPGYSWADWPEPAVRSGTQLPDSRELSAAIDLAGAYVPQVAGLASDSSAVMIGTLTWNFAPWDRLGMFGEHNAGAMWWANVALRILGNEVGFRYLCSQHFAVEAAYLTHRVDQAWVDDLETSPGGVIDRGAEFVTWLRHAPHQRLLLESHVVGRIFKVYRDTQGVTGLGLRASISARPGHAIVFGLEALRVIRSRPRTGVERVTWNVLGDLSWQSQLTPRFGIRLGIRISTNLLVGEVPMLELKRSMIDEPMAMASIGTFFSI